MALDGTNYKTLWGLLDGMNIHLETGQWGQAITIKDHHISSCDKNYDQIAIFNLYFKTFELVYATTNKMIMCSAKTRFSQV